MTRAREEAGPAAVTIRPAGANDLASWLAWAEARPPDDPAVVARVAELAADRGRAAFVAEAEGEQVGLINASLAAHWPRCPRRGPVAVIEHLYVVPHWRNRGIAMALRDALAGWARGAGAKCLLSDVDLANREGEAWHRAAGFEEVERVIAFCLPLAADRPACH